jgi:hypothetical protein
MILDRSAIERSAQASTPAPPPEATALAVASGLADGGTVGATLAGTVGATFAGTVGATLLDGAWVGLLPQAASIRVANKRTSLAGIETGADRAAQGNLTVPRTLAVPH